MRFSGGKPLYGLAVAGLVLALAGCESLGPEAGAGSDGPAAPSAGDGSATVSRDVERPDVFSVTERALWDGRPTLGGVWVAYPANVDPERVIIRNMANGKSVIGALFRRERENPGPKIQLSSDAAVALGVIAGTPTEISIVVLRREEVEVAVPEAASGAGPGETIARPPRRVVQAPAPAPAPAADSGAGLAAIVAQTLEDVPAPDAADAAGAAGAATEAATEATAGANGNRGGGLAALFALRKPYIQISTFEDEAAANALVEELATLGVLAFTQGNDPENPTLWRVVSGPYEKRAERTAQLRIIKGLGYTDAFFFR